MNIDYSSLGCNPDDWVAELKPYQAKSIRLLLENTTSIEEAAKKWLSTTGSPSIAPFGGNQDTKPFWDRFKKEFNKFVCDDSAYIEQKTNLANESGITKVFLISVISAAIGATIGFAATLLAPVVALMLCIVAQIGKNAYCNVGEQDTAVDAASQPH